MRRLVRHWMKLSAMAVPVGLAGALCLFPSGRARIIFAWGFSRGLHILEPLKQQKAGFFSVAFGDADYSNWDGTWLYVEGACLGCGKPLAPRGSFVLAKLPDGFAYATRAPHPILDSLTPPRYIPSSWIVGGALLLSFVLFLLLGSGSYLWRRVRRVWLTPAGHCMHCGYNLTGLPERRCPECGEAF